MELDQDEIDAIRTTYLQLSADQQRAGEIFYEHLFAIAPEVRSLFVADISVQSTKLISTLGLVVSRLQHWRDLEPVVEDLALRHLAYGVKPKHYIAVGRALDAMLCDILDHGATEPVRSAWRSAYRALSEKMIATAYRDAYNPFADPS